MALDFFAGCLGGCAGIVVGYPFDTVKVHIQTQDHRNPKYKGTWHCFRSLLARDSVAGLYRGMSSPMAGVAVINAIVFGVYGQSSRRLAGEAEPQLISYFVAGLSAGVAQSPVCSPMELAKTRLQLEPGTAGPVECLRGIYRAQGTRGLFSGLGITVLREAPSYGTYFASYELLTRSEQPVSTWRMLLAGGLAGTASWVVSYPLDVVKSRLQADSAGRYRGALDCFRQSVRAEGYGCLFRGLNSTIVRAFPTNAATFAVVTWTLRLLGGEPAPRAEAAVVNAVVNAVVVAEPAQRPRPASPARDRYGDAPAGGHSLRALEDATSGCLRQLANASFVLMQHGNDPGSPMQLAGKPGHRQFDEARHFDWARECIHY